MQLTCSTSFWKEKKGGWGAKHSPFSLELMKTSRIQPRNVLTIMIWWTVIHLGLSKADSFDSCWCLQNSRKRKLSQTGVEQTFSAWHWPKSIAHRFHRSWCIWNFDGLGIILWISHSCCLKFSNPWLMFPDITFSIQLKLTDNSPNPQLTSHHSTWYVSVQLRLMHKSPNPQLTPFHGTLE